MKIGIIGLGLIGTSLGLSFRNSYENLLLWGIDKDDKVLNYLSSKKIFDLLAKEIDEISDEINTSDLIFIAVYPSKVIEVLKVLKSYLGSSTTIVTDTASTKGKIMDWVNGDDFWNGVFIGGHPLAGREISGPEGALEDLFKGKIYFLIPARNVPLEKVNILKRIIKDIGALPYLLSSERHDMILAYTSHLPQIVSYLLAYTSVKEDFLDFLGRGFKDTTRIAKSDYNLWMDIIKENFQEIEKAVKEFNSILQELIGYMDSRDFEAIESLFKASREKRLKLRD